jgi:hypothetical protein
MQRIPSTSIATVRQTTNRGRCGAYTLGTASPRVCTGPGVRFFYGAFKTPVAVGRPPDPGENICPYRFIVPQEVTEVEGEVNSH